MAKLIYGTGLRKSEVHRLRVKDIDFDRCQVVVKRGKGKKDRLLPLPEACREELHLKDRRENVKDVEVPYALERKKPNARKSLACCKLFYVRQSRNLMSTNQFKFESIQIRLFK